VCLCWQERLTHPPRSVRPAGTREALNIGQLTDVSHCKLHQYLCCNYEIKYQHRSHRGWPHRVTWLSPDRLIPAW
jgi:hypothetical protein